MFRLFLFISMLTLSGCWGGGAKNVYVNRTTTVGQELSDLQQAYQKGAITEDEYNTERRKLLRGGE